MKENKVPGFTLNIFTNIKLHIPCKWISQYSGLEKEYTNKILCFNQLDNGLSIVFDSETNCFDVIQKLTTPAKIKRKNYFTSILQFIHVDNDRCSNFDYDSDAEIIRIEVKKCGYELGVIYIPRELEIFDLKTIQQRLEKIGLVLWISRERWNGICNGNIYALVVFCEENLRKFPETNDFVEVTFRPRFFKNWSKELSEKLQDEFYKFAEKSASKNVVADSD